VVKAEDKHTVAKRCCDNCTRGGVAKDCERYEGLDAEGRYNFATDADMLLRAIKAFYGAVNLSIPILLLRGSKNKKLQERYYYHPLFGKGKNKDEDWWKALGALLEREGHLSKTKVANQYNKFAQATYFQVTPAGQRWLDGGGEAKDRQLLMKPTTSMFKMLKVIKPASLYEKPQLPVVRTGKQQQDLTHELVKSLLKKRAELATAFECMPYMIASNAALHRLATRKPLNLQEMKDAQLDGFSDAKLQKFGQEFLICIQQQLCLLPGGGPSSSQPSSQPVHQYEQLTATKSTSYTLWRDENKSIADIATIRNLKESTIIEHLCDAVRAGLPFEERDLIRLGVAPDVHAAIACRLPANLQSCTLTSIKDRCPPEITFNQVKIVLVWEQQRRLGAKSTPVEENPIRKEPAEDLNNSFLNDMLSDDDEDLFMTEQEQQSSNAILSDVASTNQTEQTTETKDTTSVIDEMLNDDDEELLDFAELDRLEASMVDDDIPSSLSPSLLDMPSRPDANVPTEQPAVALDQTMQP
uniref:DNA 3'-5' helicase n=1 Tax=Anopheles maculatus TaxID=74869 RepID=A0A182SR50_9DIPT